MAEQMLEDLQAKASVQHLRGEGMPKPVEPIVSGNPRLLKDHLEALPDGVVGKRPAQPARKEGLGGASPLKVQPGREGPLGLGA